MCQMYDYIGMKTTAHSQYSGHSTSINACGVWGARVKIQVFKREFHTYIHLNYSRIEFLSCIEKNKKR